MKTIIFLHGFFASGSCVPAMALKEAFEGKYDVLAPDLPLHPHDALAFVAELCEVHKPDLIVGNSCGAFYAQMASALMDVPALLSNPYFIMTDFLKERKGSHQYKSPRADGKQEFVIDDRLIDEFEGLQSIQFNRISKAKVWGIFGDNDPIAHFEPMFLEHYKDSFHFPGAHTPTADEIKSYHVPLIEKMMKDKDPMKIVLAFDSFKGCMTAEEACRTAALAIHEVLPDAEVVECPLSDGGEGLVNCVKGMLDVNMVTIDAHDPLMNTMKAGYAISADGTTAYMEMAETSGLPLVPKDKRNPLLTTTYGVGDMIADATRRGCKKIIMGIGGSATCDAGMGMLNSLADHGVNYDAVPEIIVACDVTNPLYGENGAAYIFGPQKGATPEQVKELDERLRRIAHDMESIGVAKPEDADIPGAGAAGGLGYGLLTSLHATLKRGIDIVLDINNFNERISGSTLIITGEGKSDEQTLMGKVPHGVLSRAKERNIPVWLLSGCIDDDKEILSSNFTLVRSINEDDDRSLDTLMQTEVARKNLAKAIVLQTRLMMTE